MLYDQTSALVYSLALRVLGSAAEAEEVTLDVYARLWRVADQFDPARGSVVSWLAVMARNLAIDRRRARGARALEVELADSAGQLPALLLNPEQASCLVQQQSLVRAALQQITSEQRQAIELAFFEGLTHSELAARLGEPLGTVKSRIRNGLARLRELLGGNN